MTMERQSSDSTNHVTLLDLPENLLLHHVLSEFAATPLTLLHFSSTCKQAHRLVNAPGLWASFCREHVANEVASCFSEPEQWGAATHKQLWIGLLLPYGQLLGRLWHSATSPSGMLLAVDAEAPRLMARSLFYQTLNGAPFCHDVFSVELPGPQRKAVVTCWRGDKHNRDTHEGSAQLAPTASVAATAATAAGEVSDSGDSGSFSCSSSVAVANLLSGFELRCQGRCDALAVEITSRRLARQRYTAARQQHLASASPQQQQLQQHQQAPMPSGSSSSSSSGAAETVNSSSGSGSEQRLAPASLAPLPEMQRTNVIDLIQLISVADMQQRFAAPVYRPLDLSPWLPAAQPPSAAAAGRAVAAAGAAALESEAADAAAAASVAALSLPGCWRGTYGSHAVELVQLQLLLAPPGYNMFAARAAEGAPGVGAAADSGAAAADALAADSAADAVPGVLLAGVAGLAGAAARLTGSLRVAAAAAGGTHHDQQAQHLQQVASAEQSLADQGGGAHIEGQQQQVAPQAHQHQQRQLLLVATKLTGDVNVPAGAVTFAVDLGSKCTAGAGSRLVLPPGTDSDVQLNRAGTRQLRVKERYRGRAQIAYTTLDRPQVIAAELLLFDSPECMGLLWKRPVDSFSLFSRASELPGV